jgi:hypothetical protein
MIHIRDDDSNDNSKRHFVCGITELPKGDSWYFENEFGALGADCPTCNPGGPNHGTPITQLSGRPGHKGFEEFSRIAESWGY